MISCTLDVIGSSFLGGQSTPEAFRTSDLLDLSIIAVLAIFWYDKSESYTDYYQLSYKSIIILVFFGCWFNDVFYN